MTLLRDHLAPLLALACAGAVFVGAALDLPAEDPVVPAPAHTSR
jgi:hypothetical protein